MEKNDKGNNSTLEDTSIAQEGASFVESTSEDVQRAIEGLKDIPDEELQDFLDEDFMKGLNVVDAWESEEEENQKDRNHPSNKKEEKELSR